MRADHPALRPFTPGPVTSHPMPTGAVLLQAPFDQTAFDPALYGHAGLAVPEKLAKAVPKRLAEFLAGRLIAAHAMQKLGLPPVATGISETRAPLWPLGCSGALTHSKGQVACLLTTQPAPYVGVDIEGHLDAKGYAAVCKTALLESEKTLIAEQTDAQIAATLIFSAKETLFKALHPTVQAFFGFDAACCTGIDTHNLTLQLTRDLHPNLREGAQFTLAHQTQAAHCLTSLLAAA